MQFTPLDKGLAIVFDFGFTHCWNGFCFRVQSPELLVGYGFYDYALDLWGVGCILASLLCFREPFFRGKDNLDQLGKIIMQLGTTDLLSYILKYQIQVDPEVQKLIQSYHATGEFLNRKPWKLDASTAKEAAAGATRREPDAKGLDLLDRLLVYDHEKRWNARQAMEHPFFDIVRRRVLTEVSNGDECCGFRRRCSGCGKRNCRSRVRDRKYCWRWWRDPLRSAFEFGA